MRIGIVCYPTVGGSGVVATEMAHHLAEGGHEVHLLSYDRPSRLRRGIQTPIEVIPNFVDVDRFKPGSKGRYYQRADGERVLVHASNFRPIKRVADIVRAFAVIQREVPARLLLVGEGPDLAHALAVASDLGCQGRIEHLGTVDA